MTVNNLHLLYLKAKFWVGEYCSSVKICLATLRVNFLSGMTLIVGEEKKSNKPKDDENTAPVLNEGLYHIIKVRISLMLFKKREWVLVITYFRHPVGSDLIFGYFSLRSGSKHKW